jgi:hypothetical protein
MRVIGPALPMTAAGLAWAGLALADQEASNVAHVTAGPYGRCYAKSVPEHVYDPENAPRQSGRTDVYRVEPEDDVLLARFPWFSQKLFLRCGPGSEFWLVRVGPWHRGERAQHDHLAVAFYKKGQLLQRYSTLDIAKIFDGDDPGPPRDGAVSASVSHYSVFQSDPEMVKIVKQDGVVFSESWVIKATTADGRELVFSITSGELMAE